MENVREVNLLWLGKAILRRVWIVALAVLLFATVCCVYSVGFRTPVYEATVSVYVNAKEGSVNSGGLSASDLATAQRLVATCIYIMKSDRVVETAESKLVWDLPVEQIATMFNAKSVGETECFTITASHADPQVATDVANALGSAAVSEIPKVIQGSVISIIDEAKVPTAPSGMSALKLTLLGAFLGGVLACLGVVVFEMMDKRIKEEDDLKLFAPYMVIGTIPDFDESGDAYYRRGYGYASKTEEQDGE